MVCIRVNGTLQLAETPGGGSGGWAATSIALSAAATSMRTLEVVAVVIVIFLMHREEDAMLLRWRIEYRQEKSARCAVRVAEHLSSYEYAFVLYAFELSYSKLG